MTDAYKTLGISKSATDDEVKAAYKELAQKYNPDAFIGNPLSDLATSKMQEIDAAFDAIMNSRRETEPSKETYTPNQNQQEYKNNSSQFMDIRRYINSGQIETADELLSGIPAANRDAEWNFLKGSIYYSKGWLEEAINYFSKANQMDPSNAEYAAAYNQLMNRRRTGNYAGTNQRNTQNCSICDVCTALICADCLCDCCMGC